MSLVLLAEVAPQAWRNGGGTTRELLAWPAVDAAGNACPWQVRVSVARIDQDGGFSAFDGVDRWFTVLEGAGVTLSLPRGEVVQTAENAPVHFKGEDAPMCHLLDGPTLDLNLMVRRDGGTGAMRRASAGSRADGLADWRALYTADALTLELDGAVMPLAAGSLLWLAGEQRVGWQVVDEHARAWWLSWSAR
jgi:environmental stress-induced protein Ves